MRRRGRPRKVRDAPPAKKLFEEPDASSEEEEDPISGSDNEVQNEHEEDEADQPLINTIRSAAKLRGMRGQHQQSSSKPSSSRKSGAASVKILLFFSWQLKSNNSSYLQSALLDELMIVYQN